MKERYSEIYKKNIHGDSMCPFWRVDHGGICKGWPEDGIHHCPADENGNGCPLFGKGEKQ